MAAGSTTRTALTGRAHSSTAPPGAGRTISLTFVLGGNGVISGFNRGVLGMRVGGLRRFVLPPELAYGSSGNGPIPPNATIVFEVELTNVQ